MMINILMEAIEALTIRIGAGVMGGKGKGKRSGSGLDPGLAPRGKSQADCRVPRSALD